MQWTPTSWNVESGLVLQCVDGKPEPQQAVFHYAVIISNDITSFYCVGVLSSSDAISHKVKVLIYCGADKHAIMEICKWVQQVSFQRRNLALKGHPTAAQESTWAAQQSTLRYHGYGTTASESYAYQTLIFSRGNHHNYTTSCPLEGMITLTKP